MAAEISGIILVAAFAAIAAACLLLAWRLARLHRAERARSRRGSRR